MTIRPRHSDRLGPSIITRTGFRAMSFARSTPSSPSNGAGRTESGLAGFGWGGAGDGDKEESSNS